MSLKNFGGVLVALAMLVALGATPASSALVTYTDRTQWNSNVSTVAILGFDVPNGTAQSYSNADGSGYQQNGVQINGLFNGISEYLEVRNQTGSPWYDWNSGGIAVGPDNDAGTSYVLIALNATAFGIDLMTSPYAGIVYVQINGGDTFTVNTLAYPGRAFFGVTSDAPITEVKLTTPQYTAIRMDNVSAGTAITGGAVTPGEAPETATMLLCGSGLAAVSLIRRRRRA
jgi:hypothetical protein